MDLVSLIIMFLGYIMIYIACDVNRGPESKIESFSKEHILQVVLVTAGVLLIKYFG